MTKQLAGKPNARTYDGYGVAGRTTKNYPVIAAWPGAPRKNYPVDTQDTHYCAQASVLRRAPHTTRGLSAMTSTDRRARAVVL